MERRLTAEDIKLIDVVMQEDLQESLKVPETDFPLCAYSPVETECASQVASEGGEELQVLW